MTTKYYQHNMNCISLPDELIRKVYEYILPIFDYIEVMQVLQEYKKQEESHVLSQVLPRPTNLDGVDEKISCYENIIQHALMMNTYLLKIKHFAEKNPLFEKYARGRVLEGLAPTQDKQEKDARTMEKKINGARFTKKFIKKESNSYVMTIVKDDWINILKYRGIGNLNTIIYHCRINKIPVIDGPYAYLQRKAAGWLNDNDYRNYLVRQLIAL